MALADPRDVAQAFKKGANSPGKGANSPRNVQIRQFVPLPRPARKSRKSTTITNIPKWVDT
eukprot:514096-Prorocentrum_minimum.AAC.1